MGVIAKGQVGPILALGKEHPGMCPDFSRSLCRRIRRFAMDNMLYHINAQRLRPGSGASLDMLNAAEARAAALHIDDERRQVGACHIGNAFALKADAGRA